MQPRPEPEPEQEPGPEPEPVLRPGLSLPLPLPGVALLEWSASSGAGTRNTTSSARSRSRRGVQSSKTRSQNSHETGQKRPRDEQGGMELARDIAEIFCAAAVDPRSTALPVAKLQFIEKHVSALVRDGRYQATASDSTDTYTLPDAVRGAKADEAVKILDGLQKLVGSFRGSFPSLPPPSPPSPE
jgi:hypothetical protein